MNKYIEIPHKAFVDTFNKVNEQYMKETSHQLLFCWKSDDCIRVAENLPPEVNYKLSDIKQTFVVEGIKFTMSSDTNNLLRREILNRIMNNLDITSHILEKDLSFCLNDIWFHSDKPAAERDFVAFLYATSLF